MIICTTLTTTCPKDQLEGEGFAIFLSYMQYLAQYLAQVFADNVFSLILIPIQGFLDMQTNPKVFSMSTR